MSHPTPEVNPFMLLVHPEAVFAAVEKSERLNRLNRHLCRPLDRPLGPQAATPGMADEDAEQDFADVVTTNPQ
jgi:hypothetical protein